MSAIVWRACADSVQVAFALDDHRVAFAALVVELHVTHLLLLDQRVGLVFEPRRLTESARPSPPAAGLALA